jgi:hypothetical protein
MAQQPVLFCDDGSEVELPFKWEICAACSGHGKSSAYLGAYTQSEMDEAGPEFHDEYMRGGYDRPCISCDGLGRRMVADGSRMTRAQRAAYRLQQQADREIDAIQAAERRMGA